MIVDVRVLIALGLAVAGVLADVGHAAVGVERRDPDLREVEVVGPVVEALLRFRIRHQRAVL